MFREYLESHMPSRFIQRFEVEENWGDYYDYCAYTVTIHYWFDSYEDSESDLNFYLRRAKDVVYEACAYMRAHGPNPSQTSSDTEYSISDIYTENDKSWD